MLPLAFASLLTLHKIYQNTYVLNWNSHSDSYNLQQPCNPANSKHSILSTTIIICCGFPQSSFSFVCIYVEDKSSRKKFSKPRSFSRCGRQWQSRQTSSLKLPFRILHVTIFLLLLFYSNALQRWTSFAPSICPFLSSPTRCAFISVTAISMLKIQKVNNNNDNRFEWHKIKQHFFMFIDCQARHKQNENVPSKIFILFQFVISNRRGNFLGQV